MRNKLLLLISFVALITVTSFSQGVVKSIKLVDKAGDSTDLKTLVSENEYSLIVFWSLDSKAACDYLENSYDFSSEWEGDYNLEYVVVNIDDKSKQSKVQSYLKKKNLFYDIVLYDFNKEVKEYFHYSKLPYIILVNKEGKIKKSFTGYRENDHMIMDEKLSDILEDL